MTFVAELNRLYRGEATLHARDVGAQGFEWVDANDAENSVFSFLRRGKCERDVLLAVFNCTPIPRRDYRVGVPLAGKWRELLNSDAGVYGGSGVGNFGAVEAAPVPANGRTHALTLTLPPLGCILLKPDGSAK